MAKDTVTRYEELDRSYTKGLKLRRIFVDRKGTDLAAWLRARQGELEGKRLLCISRPRLDSDVFKFGVQAGPKQGRLAASLRAHGTGGECQTRPRTLARTRGTITKAEHTASNAAATTAHEVNGPACTCGSGNLFL